jgi:hypothetical protein
MLPLLARTNLGNDLNELIAVEQFNRFYMGDSPGLH